jgi:branched-subunit amino acid ABC-type transport system permease component
MVRIMVIGKVVVLFIFSVSRVGMRELVYQPCNKREIHFIIYMRYPRCLVAVFVCNLVIGLYRKKSAIKRLNKTNQFEILQCQWLFRYWLQNSCLYILTQTELTLSIIVQYDVKFTASRLQMTYYISIFIGNSC